MRILVVDDSKAMRLIVIRLVKQCGIDATFAQAGDGAEALAQAEADAPDLVIADWHMPVLDGPGLLVELRARGIAAPLGFVTSDASPGVRERAIAAGAAFTITKPFGPEVLADALRGTLADALGATA